MDIYAVQETWSEGSGVETSALTRNIRSGAPAAAGESCEREVRKTSRGKAAKNVDLIKILLAWMAAYGSLILFVHIYSHTGKDDPLSVGNDGFDRMAVAGAKAGRGDQAAIQRIALRSPRPAR